MTSVVPSWVVVNSVSGVLTITAPEVNSDTEFKFFINSIINGVADPIQKLIKLTILNCSPSNCQKCSSSNSSICEICNSDYYLASGTCQASSNTAKILSKLITSIIIAITGIVALTSLINLSTLASLWMTINQLQLFFSKLN